MRRLAIALLVVVIYCFPASTSAQVLKPGFDKAEYIEMLKIAQLQHTPLDKWEKSTSIPKPEIFHFVYRSPVIGLENLWDLWTSKKNVAVLSVRGTTSDAVSWLANFYSAMVPAKGTLHLGDGFTFDYNLSDHPQAAVHVGWLISTAYISRDMLPKIDSCYKAGIKDFIITGHSQGGAITFLLTSYLESLKTSHRLPADIRFKTYSSAGPKPGNLYYAYTYEHMTQEGWAYNAVNSADWVPEVPCSVQIVTDFNKVNPFGNAKHYIKQQKKFFTRIVMRHVYNRLSKPSIKAQKNYEKFLGRMASKAVKKKLPGFEPPTYYKSADYVRTGTTIVLYADDDYYKQFPPDPKQIFQNHFIGPYLYLAKKLK